MRFLLVSGTREPAGNPSAAWDERSAASKTAPRKYRILYSAYSCSYLCIMHTCRCHDSVFLTDVSPDKTSRIHSLEYACIPCTMRHLADLSRTWTAYIQAVDNCNRYSRNLVPTRGNPSTGHQTRHVERIKPPASTVPT